MPEAGDSKANPRRSLLATLAALARQASHDATLAAQALLAKTERWPADELMRHQLLRLDDLIDHARSAVPFYAERLHGVAPGRPLSPADWRARYPE